MYADSLRDVPFDDHTMRYERDHLHDCDEYGHLGSWTAFALE